MSADVLPKPQRAAERDVLYEARFRQHIKDTNSPETMPGLDQSPPLKGQPFIYIFHFHLRPDRRPDHLPAPCPICSPNAPKYFHGALAWFPVEGVYRAIGIECAKHFIGKAEAEDAMRQFRKTEKQKADFEFLFDHLGHVPQMIRYFDALMPAATHIEHLRRQLSSAHIREPLRKQLKDHGRLFVWEEATVDKFDLKANKFVTITENVSVELGTVRGLTALSNSFHPVKQIRVQVQRLGALNHGWHDLAQLWVVNEAYNHPTDMAVAVSGLLHAGPTRFRLEAKMRDVLAFFTEENFAALAKFGSDHRSSFSIFASVKNGTFRIGPTMTSSVSIRPDFGIFDTLPVWPEMTDVPVLG